MEHNEITSISALRHLAALPNLEHLSIRGNYVNAVITDPTTTFQFPKTLRSLDISRNNISSWPLLNDLPTVFPGLTTLRISNNPLFDLPPLPPSITTSQASESKPMTADEAFMLTLSRFPSSLTTLNYSTITPQDRLNAEMYYLSLIGKELSATSKAEEPAILATHPRYSELCDLYVEPTITRAVSDASGGRVIHPRSVAARLVKVAFRLVRNPPEPHQVIVKEIPGSFNTYQVKAIVSRLFELPVFGLRLIWETDEWDPIEKEAVDEAADWDEDSEDEGQIESTRAEPGLGGNPDENRFTRREVDLVESTRDIGFLFQDQRGEVKIRVECDPALLK